MNTYLPLEPLLDKGYGEPIVLLPGSFENLNHWKDVICTFSKTNRVVVPRLPLYTTPLTTTRLADLIEYLDQFISANHVIKPVLMGNGTSSHICLLYAWHYPQKAKRIIITSSPHITKSPFGNTFLSLLEYESIYEARYPTISKRQGTNSDCAKLDNYVAPSLTQINTPVLILWGLQDKITPPEIALEFHDQLPYSKITFLDHCGHLAMAEQTYLFIHHARCFLKGPHGYN